MIDVQPFDEVRSVPAEAQQPVPWHKGTLHHLFDGGWMWVIPFNNTPESKNQLISVGLMLDSRKYPKTDVDGEQEFADFLKRYPSIAPQFTKARAVREWVSADRIQYSSSECVGDRFCLLSHAAGFIDPLFSRGLFNTMQTTNVLANLLIQAVRDGDFSKARFAPVEKMQQGLIDFNDTLVNCSYISWRHYPLWNAWFRLWMLTGNYGQLRIQRAMIKYKETQDPRYLESLDDSLPGSFTKQERIRSLFMDAARYVEQVDAGTLSAEDAEKAIYALLEKNRVLLPPFFDFTSPAERMTRPHPPEKIAALVKGWVNELPEDVRHEYFDYPIEALFQQAVVKDTLVVKPA
jgi:FADH2 O2-dependent halogenase